MGAYGGDASNMTPLQARVMACLRGLRTDLDDVTGSLVDIASQIVALPFRRKEAASGPAKQPSFVAFSKEGMEWLLHLVRCHVSELQLFKSGSMQRCLESLHISIDIKYAWKQPGKGVPPWKKATSTALETIELVLPTMLANPTTSKPTTSINIWTSIVDIACSIAKGDYSSLNIPDSYDDIVTVEDDEQYDTTSLRRLRDTIMPHLGAPSIPDAVREKYFRGLFLASIIHPDNASDQNATHSNHRADLLDVPFGSVDDPEPSRREDLAYCCFAELVSCVAACPRSIAYNASSTFTTPYEPAANYGDAQGVDDIDHGSNKSEANGTNKRATDTTDTSYKVRLARAAAPFLLHRLAAPLKTYIADQPLRGRIPTPLSVMEEVLWTLSRMGELRCHARAFDGYEDRDGEGKWVQGRKSGGTQKEGTVAHVEILYPLLVKAVGVAGHKSSGDGKILAALQEVLGVVVAEGHG